MKKILVWAFVVLFSVNLTGCCGWGWYCGDGYHRGGEGRGEEHRGGGEDHRGGGEEHHGGEGRY